jgi:hypothetical protein
MPKLRPSGEKGSHEPPALPTAFCLLPTAYSRPLAFPKSEVRSD